MKRYSAWGHDGSFRFKWQAKLWTLMNKIGAGSSNIGAGSGGKETTCKDPTDI